MVRKRRRNKQLVPGRQPLLRPTQPDEVWSMGFLFDDLANGRRLKTLTVVDDCSKELGGRGRHVDPGALREAHARPDQSRAGLPKVIRTDNGPAFAGRAMQRGATSDGIEVANAAAFVWATRILGRYAIKRKARWASRTRRLR